MGKKKSGRIGGIRLEAKSSSSGDAVGPIQVKNNSSQILGPSTQKGPSQNLGKSSSLEVLVDMDFESTLEKLMIKANDEASTKTFVAAWEKEATHKSKLREANTDVSYEEFEKLVRLKKLDSNLKKCAGFARKMRQYSESQKSSLENEIKTLNLTKYLTEIAAAVTEARFKIENIPDIVTICSLVHQRYSEFASMLLDNYKKIFPLKKSELLNTSVLSKLTVDMRMIGEMITCGVLPFGDGYSLLSGIIRNLITLDKEGIQCLIPILSFCLGSGDDFFGLLPRSISKLCEQYNFKLIRSTVVPSDKKDALRELISEYFTYVSNALSKMHNDVQKSELHNRKLLRTKGEIPPDRKESHFGILSKFEKYNVNVVKFADVINEELPELLPLPVDPEEEEEKAMLMTETGEILTSVPGIVLFEDEETRSFYQDFKDLKVYLPPVAYRESIQQTAEQTQAIEEREKALADFDDELELAELKKECNVEDETNQETEGELPPSMRNDKEEKEIDKEIKPNFQVFLNQLPNCVNRNMIDKAAFEFIESHNTKPNRKKLINTLFRCPRQRMDMLPFYSRLVAILTPVMPEVGLELCQLLKNDFRFLVRRKHQIFIETKVKIVRFIGELVNFRIYPKSDALVCLKILLMDFVHHQIEMACVLIETCGRFLYRTPDSHRRMKIYLEEMMRKKTVKTLEPRYVSMIDHAYFFVLPRDDAPKPEKKKSPIEQYMEKLLLEDLSRETLDFTIEQMLSLDWDDEAVAEIGCAYLSKPWKITHQQLQYQAQVLVALLKSEPLVVTRVLDNLAEDVRRGMEHPSVDFNHRRFSTLHYFSEIYFYRLTKSENIIDMLYLLITFGVSWNRSKPTTTDPPDNMSRVRLACFLLKECGEYLNHGSNRKKLRLYLLHLQKYLWFKKSLRIWKHRRFPFGVYELWESTANQIYPKMKLAESYEEAVEELEKAEKELEKDKMESLKYLHGDKAGQGLFTGQSSQYIQPDYDPNYQYSQNGSLSNFSMACVAGSIEDDLQKLRDPYEDSPKTTSDEPDDEDFIHMFEKMCSEVNYGAARDGGKHMKQNIPIPLHISNSTHSTSNWGNRQDGSGESASDTVPFVLITRKGNKQQYKTLPLPADSDFVKRIKSREEEEREEKENVKRRTLAISQLQEAEERERENEALTGSLRFT